VDDQQDSQIITETIVEEIYEEEEPHHHHAGSMPPLFGGTLPSFGPLPLPAGTSRSEIMEEAFRRAQEASYTAGYWTAVYQMHASQKVWYSLLW